nr:uncharacterized protein CI109_003701 [Kwoniella shandongensis]KAA5528046.1 hypothetical protein CI109_003701 [Kwoniella shandongensis]
MFLPSFSSLNPLMSAPETPPHSNSSSGSCPESISTPHWISDEGSVSGGLDDKLELSPVDLDMTITSFDMSTYQFYPAPSDLPIELSPHATIRPGLPRSPQQGSRETLPMISSGTFQSHASASCSRSPQDLTQPIPSSFPESSPASASPYESGTDQEDNNPTVRGLEYTLDMALGPSADDLAAAREALEKPRIQRPPNDFLLFRKRFNAILKIILARKEDPDLGDWEDIRDIHRLAAPREDDTSALLFTKDGTSLTSEDFIRMGSRNGKAMPMGQLGKVVGELWRNEAPEMKEYFRSEMERMKKEHAEKYPGWQYKPRSKIMKAREQQMRNMVKAADKVQKEMEKRQKRAPKTSNKYKRTTRPRARRSSTSPSPTFLDTHRFDVGLNRCPMYALAGPGPTYNPSTNQTNAYQPQQTYDPIDEHGMILYPFPSMHSALPSIPPGGYIQTTPGALIAESYQAWNQQRNTPGPTGGDVRSNHVDQSSNFYMLTQPVSATSDSQTFVAQIASHPAPGSGTSMYPQGLEEMLSSQEHEVVAGWADLDVENAQNYMDLPESAAGLLGDDNSLDPYLFATAAGQCDNGDPFGYNHTGFAATSGDDQLPQGYYVMPGQEEYIYPQSIVPRVVSVPSELDPASTLFAPDYNPDMPFLVLEALNDDPTSSDIPQGPTLSAQQPLSPTDSLAALSPQDGISFALASNDLHNRAVSSSSTEGSSFSTQTGPRYVSGSSFPATPNDPSSMTTRLVDRQISHSFADLWNGQTMEMAGDVLGWDDEANVKEEDIESTEKAMIVPATMASTTSVPPRVNVRRGRAVAGRHEAVAMK